MNNWDDKVRWLLRFLKCDAYNLVQCVTLDQAGYNQAIKELDNKYLCTNIIQEDIFDYIYSFSIPDLGKNHHILSSKLIELRNYIHELTDLHGFEMNNSLSKLIGHIIMKNLPCDVKRQFYIETKTLYPDYDVILEKVNLVI